jgi:hypothetical protein
MDLTWSRGAFSGETEPRVPAGRLRPDLAARPVSLASHEPHPLTSHTCGMDKTGIKVGKVVGEYVKLPRWSPRGRAGPM